MAAAIAIDKQITAYLNKLSLQQKKAVLTVVKTFADEKNADDHWGRMKNFWLN